MRHRILFKQDVLMTLSATIITWHLKVEVLFMESSTLDDCLGFITLCLDCVHGNGRTEHYIEER